MKNEISTWLKWAREIQALSQSGLTFASNEFDIQRYQRFMEIAAEIVSEHTSIEKQRVLLNFMLQQGYATPKIDVRGAVVSNNKILLVQERSDQCWCMPGGWADVGDIPSEAAEREVLEESGFNVSARKIIGVYDANRDGRPIEFYHAFKIIFLCDIVSGEATTSYETIGVDFFDFENLPSLSENRTNKRHLSAVLSHISHQNLPTEFD